MKRALLISLAVTALTACRLDSAEDQNDDAVTRTWTDITGTYSVVAEFVGLEDGHVRIKKQDGTVISVPLEKLTLADQQFAEAAKHSVARGIKDQPAERGRTFIEATSIVTEYGYGGGILGATGIPSEAKYLLDDKKTIVATAETAENVKEVMVDEHNERVIRVTLKLSPRGKSVATIVARFKPTGLGGKVRKATIDGAWESRYIFEGEHAALGLGVPRIETYDLKTGEKVAETRNIRVLGDAQFSGEEVCYDNGKIVFRSSFVRHVQTGLLVSETVQEGNLPMDYHHYELVLAGWPDGRTSGFLGGMGGRVRRRHGRRRYVLGLLVPDASAAEL